MNCKEAFGSWRRAGLCLGAAVWLAPLAGCSLDFLSGDSSLDATVSAEINASVDTVDDDEVRIRFINRTNDDAVDVEFFATNEPLAKLPDELFVEAYRITREIGLAGRGVLAPHQSDEITFPCTGDLTIGTAGGAFADADTGDERGAGDPRWAQDHPLGLCGRTVTFEFVLDRDTYITRIELGN